MSHIEDVKDQDFSNTDCNAIVDGDSGRTDLMVAAEAGNAATVQLMMKECRNLDYSLYDYEGETPLMLAAKNGHLDVVRVLLSNPDVDVDFQNYPRTQADQAAFETECEGFPDITALMFAASRGHIEIVKELLEHKADANLRHSEGATALILAAVGDHTEIVDLLVRTPNIDCRLAHDDGFNAIYHAFKEGNDKAVELMHQHCPDFWETWRDAMQYAIYWRSPRLEDETIAEAERREENDKTIERLRKFFEDRRNYLIDNPCINGPNAGVYACPACAFHRDELLFEPISTPICADKRCYDAESLETALKYDARIPHSRRLYSKAALDVDRNANHPTACC